MVASEIDSTLSDYVNFVNLTKNTWSKITGDAIGPRGIAMATFHETIGPMADLRNRTVATMRAPFVDYALLRSDSLCPSSAFFPLICIRGLWIQEKYGVRDIKTGAGRLSRLRLSDGSRSARHTAIRIQTQQITNMTKDMGLELGISIVSQILTRETVSYEFFNNKRRGGGGGRGVSVPSRRNPQSFHSRVYGARLLSSCLCSVEATATWSHSSDRVVLQGRGTRSGSRYQHL